MQFESVISERLDVVFSPSFHDTNFTGGYSSFYSYHMNDLLFSMNNYFQEELIESIEFIVSVIEHVIKIRVDVLFCIECNITYNIVYY